MKRSLSFILLICFFQICLGEETHKANNGIGGSGFVSVNSFGAIGDGKTDDTQAFLKTWEAVCKGESGGNTQLLVPQGKTFMLKPLTFVGPCKSSSISFLINGNIVAPGYTWNVRRDTTWISFESINGLVVSGGGTIDGRGSLWWGKVRYRPSAMHFNNCNGLKMSNLQQLNSPKNHMGISCSTDIEISGLKLTAPGDSPNTDGIDISNCKRVNIHDSVIATGDDCIAVNSGSSLINITNILCGPGHGISVGSLGASGDFETVEEVTVKNCTFTNTQNGVRIKTYQNGSGYARKISFEDINMVNSRNPIIIDQNYMSAGKKLTDSLEAKLNYQSCHLSRSLEEQLSQSSNGKGVKVSDVRYANIYGSSASDQAVTLDCDADLGCADIVMDHVNMVSATSGHKVFASCSFVDGTYFASEVSCLKKVLV